MVANIIDFVDYAAFNKAFSDTEHGLPLIVDFYTPACGPCRGLKETFVKLANQYSDKATFAMMDFTKFENPEKGDFFKRFNFLSVPKFMIVQGGEVKEIFPEKDKIKHSELESAIETYMQGI